MTLLDKLKQFIVYVIVGSLNTVVALGVIYVFSEILRVHYVLANAAGYAVGLAIGFVMHRKVTFAGADKSAAKRQVAPFLGVFAVSYLIQLGLLVALHRAGMVDFFSQVVALGVYVIISFIGHKYLTFRIPRT